MIHLEDVTPDNWREKLTVNEEQTEFVSNTYSILARAYAYRKHGSCVKMIYNNEIPVGLLLFYESEELNGYNFSQLLIDKRYQRKGYGLEATKLILKWMKEDKKYDTVYLCYLEGNIAAKEMYSKLGFSLTGEQDEDEIVMSLNLTDYKDI